MFDSPQLLFEPSVYDLNEDVRSSVTYSSTTERKSLEFWMKEPLDSLPSKLK